MTTPVLAGALPILRWLPHYRTRDLRADLLAGAVVAALAVPQSLGYAAVAGVAVQIGLYTLPPTLLAYAVFGSSRQLMVGPVSTVSLLSGSLVAQASHGDPHRAALLTSALAVSAGIVLVAAGLLRIGWVAEFLSEPIVAGFVTGLVVLVVVGQLPLLLGLPAAHGSLIQQVLETVRSSTGAPLQTLAVGAVALVLLFGGQRLYRRVPWGLVVLAGGITSSRLLDLPALGIATIGSVPSGIKVPALPVIPTADIPTLITGGLAVAMVGLAEGLAAVRLFAQAHDEQVDTDQELIAHGVADLAAGLTGGMAVAGSLSKTAAAERAGGRTQVVGLVAALLVVLVVLVAAPLASALPAAVLAAIVVHAVWGLVHPTAFRRYFGIRRNDGIAAIVALIGVLVLGPLYGLLVAVGQSLLGLIYRSVQVHIDEMGRVPGEKAAWGSVADHPERRTADGVLVLRLDAPLFWVNAATVIQRLLQIVRDRPDVRALVLDLEATNQLDVTTERRLEYLLSTIRAGGQDLYLVRVFDQVRVVLGAAGFYDRLGDQHVWHSIAAGVRAARHAAEEAVDLPEDAAAAEDADEQIVSRSTQ